MALYKSMELENGVVVNYHRITSLNIITNVQNVIEISSYTSEAKREEEQKALSNGELSNVYVHTRILSAPYDQSATIQSVYEHLKMLPEFEGSTDI